MSVALGSASEVRYLLGLSVRLGMLSEKDPAPLHAQYDELVRGLQKLIDSLH